MSAGEQAIVFACEGEALVGILSGAGLAASRGVLIVVGGPQYRAGSHRQFTLLARHLARSGVPALRFDYRGMGDASGEPRSFENVHADIGCAIDLMFARVPGLKEVVLWGLCDAASAVLFYAHRDARVKGLVLLNPWVRTEQGLARVHLRHYYLRRLLQASLWRKLARRELRLREALAGLRQSLGRALAKRGPSALPGREASLPDRMEDALRRFGGKVLLVLSGDDLTAQEFRNVVAASRGWQDLLDDERVTRRDLPQANHTFARREWRDQVARWTEAWVRGL